MKIMKRMIAALFCALIFSTMLKSIYRPVNAAGSLSRIYIGFNRTLIVDIGINPNLAESDLNSDYSFDTSSTYHSLGVIPTSVSMRGVSVISSDITQDQNYPYDTMFRYVKGETRPDGVITLRIAVTDLESSGGSTNQALYMEVRYYDEKGLGQYDNCQSSDSQAQNNPHIFHDVEREQLAWMDAVTVSMDDTSAEFIITIDLNGPVQAGNVQNVTQTAAPDAGEDNGTTIWEHIINNQGKNNGMSAGTLAVLSIGGALAAAGFLGGSSGKNGDGGEENGKQKTYKMKVYKNFGNGIHKGADPVSVWARIVEVIDGEEINRPELSERITVSGSGMHVRDAGMHNSYRGAEVRVPADCEEEKVTLTFTYEGEGGIFRNNIIFNVLLDPEIMFPTLSQDGREWIMHSEPLNLVAGSGGSARKLFVFDHVSEEPKSIVLNAEGFEVTYEKLDRYPYAYHAVIHNRTAPFEKEAGIFGQQQTVYVNIKAEFPDGSIAENGFSFGLWPEGITVLYSRGQANDLIVHRPGMPAKLQNGRIDVRSYLEPEDKDGRIPDTAFDICCAVPQEDGTAKLVTDSRSYELADLRADDEIATNVLAKYKCVIGTVDGEEYRSAVIAPQLMNPELVDSYDVWLPVRVQTEGVTISADVPMRLVGQEPGPSAEWKEEYRLLIRAVNSYYPEEKKVSKLREIEENFNSPMKCDVAELRMLRRTLILWSTVYWQQQIDLVEKEEWDYWSKVWLLSEWGSRKLKWAGDIAFTLLISYKLGSNYEAWLSPLKDFITENLGEAIAESWGDNATTDGLEFLSATTRPVYSMDEGVNNKRAEKFMKKFEDKLYTAFENLLTNQINTDRMDMKLSMSHAASRKLFLKTGLILAGFLIIDFAKNYREMSVEERDCWKAFAKAFSNLSQTAVKQIFASYVAKWMNSKTMQEFFRSKFMKAVNDKVKGVTKGSYTAYNKNYQKLTVRYRGQKVSLSGQATGNVDAGRLDARTFRVHLDDGRTVAIPNVRPDKRNDYLGYIEVISALLSDFFGKALELEIDRDLKMADAAGVIFFQLPMATELSGAALYARVDLKALCTNPGSEAFTMVYNAIFACLKLDNEHLFSLVNLPYAEAMRIITTSKTLWERLTAPNWPEQIDWSIFDESEGYTR